MESWQTRLSKAQGSEGGGSRAFEHMTPWQRTRAELAKEMRPANTAATAAATASVPEPENTPENAPADATKPTQPNGGTTATEEKEAPPAAKPRPKAVVRIPYRANVLTRALRNCFEDESHRTAIVAAVAPGAESVIHSLNTLDHVLMMAPHLKHLSCEVDVPMRGGGQRRSYEDTPVHEWTAEQVIDWLAHAEGGRFQVTPRRDPIPWGHPPHRDPTLTHPPPLLRFQHVVVPKGTEGKDLLRLNARKLTDLAVSEDTEARGEGQQGWYVSQQAKVGRALFSALRDAQRSNGIRGRG